MQRRLGLWPVVAARGPAGTVSHMADASTTPDDDTTVEVHDPLEVEPTGDLTSYLPARLSPSRAKTFKQCPKKFFYTTICRWTEPNTFATAKGTLAHHAFEQVFELPRGERTPDAAVGFVAPHWAELRNDPLYGPVIAEGGDVEQRLVNEAEEAVRRWFAMEDPNRFDPAGIELHVEVDVDGFGIHGFIDRLDRVVVEGSPDRILISDYKTGKLPRPRYVDDAFFAMHWYALMLADQHGMVAEQVRLLFVNEGTPDAILIQQVTADTLARTRREVNKLVAQMRRAASTDKFVTRTGPLCNWCHFQDICPAFATELNGQVGAPVNIRAS